MADMQKIRTYSELVKLQTFSERFNYLKLQGFPSVETFGHLRFMNQELYKSRKWAKVRREVILRDNGCDLGLPGYELNFGAIIHHIEPLTPWDLLHDNFKIYDLNNLITVSLDTHNAIHYGRDSSFDTIPKPRTIGDTCPWRNHG